MFTTKFEFLKILETKTIKISQTVIVNFEMVLEIEFMCGIRGHHVYKRNWIPVLNEKLNCKKDNREEALSYDKHSVGVFKKEETLVVDIPIELSRLIYYFMKENKKNFVSALIVGSRKREVGLAVPAKFTAFIKELRVATFFGRNFRNKEKICPFLIEFCGI